LEHRYTRNEVERMMGVSRRDLDYWTRLRLVLPRARWGERFFNFSDLVALETIKRLAARKVPAGRIRRAVTILQTELGSAQTPLSMLRISTNGKEVVVYPQAESASPFEPLTGQFVLNFETAELAKKVHAMASRSAEEWFEFGMLCDTNSESRRGRRGISKSSGGGARMGGGAHQPGNSDVSAGTHGGSIRAFFGGCEN
jgi:DNA-binding transcriptional MerR regulator